MNQTTRAFLQQLHNLGIQVWDDDGYLGYRAPEGTLTPDLLAQLKTHKDEILHFLQSAKATPQQVLIPSVPRSDDLPLSFAQERLWIHQQMQGVNAAYNMPLALRLRGNLNVDALEKSLQAIVARHEILRTTIGWQGEETAVSANGSTQTPSQTIHNTPFHLNRIDLRQHPRQAAEAQRRIAAEAQRPFDLSQDLMLRATLLQLGNQEFILLLVLHHIAADGWSLNVIQQEIATLYTAFSQQQTPALPDLPLQYADFAAWQRQQIETPVMAEQLAYWQQQLANAPTAIDLPIDYPRPPRPSYRGTSHHLTLSSALSTAVKKLSQQQGCTLFTTLLAAYTVLLARYSGQSDILVGVSIAGRNRPELEPLIGFFVNNLIYRSDLAAEPTFLELLQQVQQTAVSAQANQDYPFDQLFNTLDIPRDASRAPLAQARFAFHPQSEFDFTDFLPQIETALEPLNFEFARYDLNLRVLEQASGLGIWFSYNTDLFAAATIARMAEHFQQLLTSIVADPDQQVSRLSLLTAAERHKLLVEWNQTAQELPLSQSFQQLFEAQVEKTPQAIAAVANGQSLTYAQLNERTNRLAHWLVAQGIGDGEKEASIVGLLGQRSLDFLTAVLAIFKAGGVYLPIDPRSPAARQRQMVQQSRCALILAANELAAGLEEALGAAAPPIAVLEQSLAQAGSATNLPNRAQPDDLAYVIFTSGSTGLPKGAMVEQKGMVNHLYAKIVDLELTAADQIAQTAPQSFDISVWQFLAALLVGGTVHIYNDEIALNPSLLLDHVQNDRISIWETVPSLMRALLDTIAQNEGYTLPALRWLIPTGEALPPQLANQWLTFYPHVPLVNAYGPTECSDDVTHYIIREPLDPHTIHTPIGRPIVNMCAYILDKHRQPTPTGVPGELWIGGVGVGRGYLNDAERTAVSFIPDPFSPLPSSPPMGGTEGGQARLYKTGDRARYLPDGNIEFLGRLDFQVKIRGFRIELGEIEAAIQQHPAIRECLVLVHQDKDEATFKSLVAYLVPAKGQQSATLISDVRHFLQDKVPDYMLPAFFVVLAAMPLTPNGKINRRALPAPDANATSRETPFVPPQTPLQKLLAAAWQTVLKVDKISLHDNFFEIGGDSIRGAILINQLQQQFQEVLYVVALFDAPTIAQLADYFQQHYPQAVRRLTADQASTTQNGQSQSSQKVDDLMLQQFRQLIPPLAPAAKPHHPKNRKAVFVLSAPRSGSTLFRVMLGGHAQLFSPPELDLLGFNTLGERAEVLGGRYSFRLEGLLRALMTLNGWSADEAKAQMVALETADLSTAEFYRQLQTWLGNDKLLVDKTPIYALDPYTLRRAEDYFEEVSYIHLLRHPAGMIRSFEKARTDQVFFRYENPFTPRQLAEMVWTVSHQNILDFLQNIPAARQHRVTYEGLVADPLATSQAICAFLNLPFDPGMVQPYADTETRMTDGIYDVSKMLGDPKFHSHGKIDPQVAERWREEYTEDFIGEPTWTLAEELGYKRPFAPPTLQPIQRRARQRQRVQRS